MISVMFARKPQNFEELNLIKSEIAETIELSQNEYDHFISNMLAEHKWLTGKGGHINGLCQVVKLHGASPMVSLVTTSLPKARWLWGSFIHGVNPVVLCNAL